MDNKTYLAEYYIANKKQILLRASENAKKTRKENPQRYRKVKQKSAWKCKGIKNVNDEMYNEWLTTENCNICNCILIDSKRANPQRRCLDHCHISGYKRFICCNECNKQIGVRDRLHQVVLLQLNRYFNSNCNLKLYIES